MGDVVNLNKFRKNKNREQLEKRAKQNRTRFGRTKQQKTSDRQIFDKNETNLTGKKLTKSQRKDEPPAGDK